MSSSANFFLKKALGEDFFQSLEKFELWKQGTKTVIDHEEIKTALKIVPRTLMSFLISHLQPMKIGDTKEIRIPLEHGQPLLRVTKHEKDVYSGEIEDSVGESAEKKVAEFKYRSIPGVGLVVMSAFELYSVEDLDKAPQHEIADGTLEMVQKLIDERLALHDLIGKVVDKRLAERDAVQQLVLAKLSDKISEDRPKDRPKELESAIEKDRPKESAPEMKKSEKQKGSPLKGFLENRSNKLKKKEYSIELVKGENVSCPDCGQNIFDGKAFSGCVCFGDDMDKKVYLAKSENGFKVRFGKGWDEENIEMLLEVLRRKRG